MKRVRIRLKAESSRELRLRFRHRLREDGVLLPARWELPVGEEVEVAIYYRDRTLALDGRGRVVSRQRGAADGDDFWVELEWSARSRASLAFLLSRDRGEVDASNGLSFGGLELPVPVPRPAAVDATADVLQVGVGPAGSVRRAGPGGPEPEARDTGEVTPLARIELVRRGADPTPVLTDPPELDGIASILEGGPPALDPKGRCVLGVDFGSSFTRIAVHDGEALRSVPTRRGLQALPTVVHADPRGKTFVGEAAVRRSEIQPALGVRDFRRLMGRAFAAPGVQSVASRALFSVVAGPQGETAVALDEHVVPLEEVASLIFKEVREGSSLVLSDRANRAVVTVPSWSGPALRDSCRMAAELGGLHVERLVGEAVAVAVEYAHRHRRTRGTALVVSLGAGLLDLALVEHEDARVRVLNVGGSFEVGGIDFDRALERLFVEAVEDATGERPAETPDFWARLSSATRRVKEALSSSDETTGELVQPLPDGRAFRLELDVTRRTAEVFWSSLQDRVVDEVQSLLARSEFEHVDRVLAAGEQLRTPHLAERIRALLPSSDWLFAPPEAAARGAAVIGRRLAAGELPGVVERSPRSLAVASRDVEVRLLFRAGVSMPASRELDLQLGPSGRVVLLEARPDADEGWSAVGALDLDVDGVARVSLRVSLSSDGQLGIVGELPGTDWRPIGLEPSSDHERSSPWWSELPFVAGGAADPSEPDGGFVGWLRRRLKPR